MEYTFLFPDLKQIEKLHSIHMCWVSIFSKQTLTLPFFLLSTQIIRQTCTKLRKKTPHQSLLNTDRLLDSVKTCNHTSHPHCTDGWVSNKAITSPARNTSKITLSIKPYQLPSRTGSFKVVISFTVHCTYFLTLTEAACLMRCLYLRISSFTDLFHFHKNILKKKQQQKITHIPKKKFTEL